MGFFNIVRAIIVRLCFACHGLLAILLLTISAQDRKYWLLSGALVGLLVESIVTLCKKRGREWTWFCPSVFFYLLSTVPAIWFLELHALEKRIMLSHRKANTTVIFHNETTDLTETMKNLGMDFTFKIPKLDYQRWIQIIEQFLLLLLILGRWMLPKGKLTHDQLSQLLLVYIGTAADIVEFFEAFKEDEVKENRLLCRIILSIWSWSLLQFTMVLTATRVRKDQSGIFSKSTKLNRKNFCTPDVYGIVISIMMQDLPFLILRLVLIFHYGVLSYTNMFFTAKNTLVILLLLYRLIVVQITLYERAHRQIQRHKFDRKESEKGLLNGYSEMWKLQLPGECTCENGTTVVKRNNDETELDFFNFYDKKRAVNISNGRSNWDPVAERAPSNPIPRRDPCTSFTLMLQASKIMNDYHKQRKLQGDVIVVSNDRRNNRSRVPSTDEDDEVEDIGTTLHLMA